MKIRIEENHMFVRHLCFCCGMNERPDNPDAFAYEGDEFLGWVCFQCQKLDEKALQERIRDRAASHRSFADDLDDVASQPIELPSPEEFAAMKAQREAIEAEYQRWREQSEPSQTEEDPPF